MIKRCTVILIILVIIPAIAWGMDIVSIKDKAGNQVGLYKESHALVIGVSQYTAGWPSLRGVKKDIVQVRQALESAGFHVVVVENPNRPELDSAIRNFIDDYGHEKNNRLLFYYAGHGHTLKTSYGDKMGYIVPRDAPDPNKDPRGFRSKAMDMQQFEVYAKRIQSKHALFLFDSCFSGSIFALDRAIPADITYKTNQPVRQFITAGNEDETVPDKSIFSQQFVSALEGEGDTDGDGYITGSELGAFLEKTVINYSRGSQHPQYGKIRNPHLDKGDFVFPLQTARLVTPTPSLEPSPPPAPSFVPAPTPVILQGHLQVNVNVPVNVQVDGEQKGTARPGSPLNLRDLSTGTVMVRLEAEGYQPMEKSVTIQRGQWTQEVFELQRERVVSIPLPPEPKPVKPATLEGMVEIPAGEFLAGSSEISDAPVHMVFLPMFFIDKYEVTASGFAEFVNAMEFPIPTFHKIQLKLKIDMGCNFIFSSRNSRAKSGLSNHPVNCVSWGEAEKYCQWKGKRLPTEAEWEKAAKGGRDTLYPWGNRIEGGKANICDRNCSKFWKRSEFDDGYATTAPVGSYSPNGYGLYDMAGNVTEWVNDWYEKDAYRTVSRDNPMGPSTGEEKVHRGGSWFDKPFGMRSAYRFGFKPDFRIDNLGFRCVQ